MSYFHFHRIATAFCFVLLFINIPFATGQYIPATPAAENETDTDLIDPFKISVNVSEIRLDVVVVDGKGRPIRDLTADDFEVYQDSAPQEVTSSTYINDQTSAATEPVVSRKDAPNLLQSSAPVLKEEEVRRTILFLFDDISMSFEHLHNARMSIKHFLDKQMQPGDLVAVTRTSSGSSALNMFSSDKHYIAAQVDSTSAQGEFFGAANDPSYRIYDSQLFSLFYNIRALRNMPGRKILFLLTTHPTISSPDDNFTTENEEGVRVHTRESERAINYNEMYGGHFSRLADYAMRAGVVVHLLDPRGLTYEYDPQETRSAFNPLPAKTGGIIVSSNFFLNGIGNDANNMISGYYLVSYVPPSSTFELKDNKDVYHRVAVKVKRKGAVVHTREGFYGRKENVAKSATPMDPLLDAILSPFQYADINANMVAGYTKDDKSGYLVRSWVHLDPKNMTIIETEDGSAFIKLETLCLTSGLNGAIHDERHIQYTFNIAQENKAENIAWIQKHGIRFSMLLPVKKPGFYSVRVAVKDTESGKVGSTYQLLEIPDLRKKRLELSNIFMITSDYDLNWMHTDVAKELSKAVFFPIFQAEEVRSPALRTYLPGDNLQTLAILYNSDAKALARSEIEFQSILYRNGREFLLGESKPINSATVKTSNSIPIMQRLTLGSDLPPGDYVLQLLVTDKKNSEKKKEEGLAPKEEEGGGIFSKIIRAYLNEPKNHNKKEKGVASQTLSFKVTEKP